MDKIRQNSHNRLSERNRSVFYEFLDSPLIFVAPIIVRIRDLESSNFLFTTKFNRFLLFDNQDAIEKHTLILFKNDVHNTEVTLDSFAQRCEIEGLKYFL